MLAWYHKYNAAAKTKRSNRRHLKKCHATAPCSLLKNWPDLRNFYIVETQNRTHLIQLQSNTYYSVYILPLLFFHVHVVVGPVFFCFVFGLLFVSLLFAFCFFVNVRTISRKNKSRTHKEAKQTIPKKKKITTNKINASKDNNNKRQKNLPIRMWVS